jgi:hypothetical protein
MVAKRLLVAVAVVAVKSWEMVAVAVETLHPACVFAPFLQAIRLARNSQIYLPFEPA